MVGTVGCVGIGRREIWDSDPMEPTVVVRSSASRALGLATMGIAALGLLTLLAAGPSTLQRWGAPVALVGAVGWAALWRPHVEVADGGVRVVNTLRTVEVPWPALHDVDGRYGLRLETEHGAVQAWGAAAPRRTRTDRSPQSEAAVVVRERWERLQAQGHLDAARLERDRLAAHWHLDAVLGIGVLGLLSAVSLVV